MTSHLTLQCQCIYNFSHSGYGDEVHNLINSWHRLSCYILGL